MRPRQVQDFIPTPMSMATAMYYTGIDPLTSEPVYTATRSAREALHEGAAALLGPGAAGRSRARR